MAELTGRHVLAITVSAFAVIIGVNVLLAVKAVSTFPGLEVENSYVAGQDFNERKAAQEALGWVMTPAYDRGRMTLAFTGPDGLPVTVSDLQVLVGRTTEAKDDVNPVFAAEGDLYAADVALGKGKWMLKVTASSADGTLFEQRSELYVKG
ncbi:FixH family protein [Tabrizicola sp.]|uniref:FixH family protein n=1 Tax=Tabrizicola sp. TaxID=2005166 RepID=UPI001A3B25B1|nr:FixH family protein [Tabrizicola sp.]MBL9062370.1 FixH family protein [Tabrizicola sp.]